MRYGIALPNYGPLATAATLVRLARRAEELGVDSVWVSDHLVAPTGVQSIYPYDRRPDARPVADPFELVDEVSNGGASGAGVAVIGTPEDAVAAIRTLYDTVGGFGVVLGFAHDWASYEATKRSWDLFARYVIPEVNGYLRGLRASAEYLAANKGDLIAGATAAVLDQIMANPRAAEALDVTIRQMADREPHE